MNDEITNPRLYAFLIGLVGAAFSVVVMLVVMIPISAFLEPDLAVTGAIVIGTATFVFSIGFMYGLLRVCEKARSNLEFTLRVISERAEVVLGQAEVEIPDEVSPIGERQSAIHIDERLSEDFIKIEGTPKTVRVTDGVTVGHVRKLAEASLPAVSQRALDAAGVITRDPAVEVNAKVFITWLSRNNFIKPIGNSRYEFTDIGRALLKSASGTRGTPPPTTAQEQ